MNPYSFVVDLIAQTIYSPMPSVLAEEDELTRQAKAELGECDYACHWCEPYGWVPECGCPVHD